MVEMHDMRTRIGRGDPLPGDWKWLPRLFLQSPYAHEQPGGDIPTDCMRMAPQLERRPTSRPGGATNHPHGLLALPGVRT